MDVRLADFIRRWPKMPRLGVRCDAGRWAGRLEEVSRDLGSLAQETEGEVLSLGSRLESFAQAAERVSRQAQAVVEAVRTADQMARAGEVFASASGRLTACNGELVTGTERMAAIARRLEGLFRFQRPLSHLTRTVRILRVATRMETARLKDELDDLGMLADEIDQFSQRMDSHVAAFFEGAGEVGQEAARLVNQLEADRRAYKERLDGSGQATGAALEHIGAILGRAADLSEACARRTRDVVREVGEIVSSLQFHDITRQQLQHVQEALGEAVAGLRERAAAGRRHAPPLAVVRRILVLQGNQLSQVKAEIEASGERIMGSLKGIAEGCQAHAQGLAPLVGRATQDRGLSRLEEQLATLAGVLEQGSRLSRGLLEATRAAAELLGKMKGGLVAVRSVSEELNLLALNALVKVARQGEEGRALAEVAESINRLSLEPREVVGQAAEEVRALLEEARELSTLHEAGLAENQRQAEDMARTAEEALHGLRALSAEVSGTVASLAGETGGLVSSIGGVVGTVRFHRLVSDRVEAAMRLLEECRQDLGGGAEEAAAAGAAGLGWLARRYTMESERRVHRTVLKEPPAREVPQARPEAAVSAAEAPGGGGDEELGDNVDLF